MKTRLISLLIALLFIKGILIGAEIGVVVVATGKYIRFIKPLIESAEKFFLTEHHKKYYVFTDGECDANENIIEIYQERLGWPFDTLKRYHIYLSNFDYLKELDYIYAIDADMLFVDYVGDEVLGKRVAVIHPGFYSKRGSYETNPNSNAFVSSNEGKYYFAGGFYGGTAKEFHKIISTNVKKINDDLKRDFIAVWHDESHWNRYCIDHKPTVILSPSYCYPESWDIPFRRKLIALDKNHSEFQIPKQGEE